MADDEKTPEVAPEQEAVVEDKDGVELEEKKDDVVGETKEEGGEEKTDLPVEDAAEAAETAEEKEVNEDAEVPAEETREDEKPLETDNTDENIPIPENEGVPEEDVTPAVEVAEHMSREGTPTGDAETDGAAIVSEVPDATVTPPPADHEEMYDEEDEEGMQPTYVDSYADQGMFDEDDEYYDDSEPEEPMYNRQELLDKYHQALEERSSLQSLNAQLQHKLAEYFKKKKSDERHQEIEKSVTDQEQRYLKYMSNLEELQDEEKHERESYKMQIEDVKAKCHEREEAVEQASAQFTKFKLDVAKEAINSRSGKPIPPKDVEQHEMLENKKEQEVTQVRLENIKLRNRLKKREIQLKAKEELAEGLHLIDFEQLKIENQTYNEKIEERNEELLKLRKKITTTVQVLTHLKEKLQFVQVENGDQRTNLRSVEALVAQKRDILTRTKQVRDALRIENVKLRQKCGLLGNESLLRDYELRKDQSDDLSSTIEKLKMTHAELTMNCAGVKKKIDQARQEQ